jgi:hypothetical protein
MLSLFAAWIIGCGMMRSPNMAVGKRGRVERRRLPRLATVEL